MVMLMVNLCFFLTSQNCCTSSEEKEKHAYQIIVYYSALSLQGM